MTELQVSLSAVPRRRWSIPLDLQVVTLFSLLGFALSLAFLFLPISDAPTESMLAFMP